MKVDLENELTEARTRLAAAKSDETKLRLDAEQLVEKRKGEGADILGDQAIFDEIDAAYKLADAKADEVASLNQRIAKTLGWVKERSNGREGHLSTNEARTIMARLCEAGEYAGMVKQIEMNGFDGARMGAVQLLERDETIDALRLNTTVDNTSGSGGGLIWSDRKGIVVPIPQRSVRLLDIITIGTTDSDTIEFVRETTHTDAASEKAYGTALDEAAYGYTKDSTTVKRRGHWIPATDGALMDAGQLETILRANLASGLLRRTEEQAYAGTGSGEQWVGITDSSRVGVQTMAKGSDTLHDVFHKALTKIRVAKLDGTNDPNGFVIDPRDWEELVLETDDDGNYIHGGGATEPTTVWGVRPVVTTLATQGEVLYGDFTQAVLWVRSGTAISVSNSHSDFFTRGLAAMKAEYRGAFDVLQEAAFVLVDLTS